MHVLTLTCQCVEHPTPHLAMTLDGFLDSLTLALRKHQRRPMHECLRVRQQSMIRRPDRAGRVGPATGIARHFVDTLAMLEKKTAGNLTADEARMLEEIQHQLRMMILSGGPES